MTACCIAANWQTNHVGLLLAPDSSDRWRLLFSLTDRGGRLLLRKPSYLCTRREPCARGRRIRKMNAQVRDAGRELMREPADRRVSQQHRRNTRATADFRTSGTVTANGNSQIGTHLGRADTAQSQQPTNTGTSQQHRRNTRPSAGSCAAGRTGASGHTTILECPHPARHHKSTVPPHSRNPQEVRN